MSIYSRNPRGFPLSAQSLTAGHALTPLASRRRCHLPSSPLDRQQAPRPRFPRASHMTPTPQRGNAPATAHTDGGQQQHQQFLFSPSQFLSAAPYVAGRLPHCLRGSLAASCTASMGDRLPSASSCLQAHSIPCCQPVAAQDPVWRPELQLKQAANGAGFVVVCSSHRA